MWSFCLNFLCDSSKSSFCDLSLEINLGNPPEIFPVLLLDILAELVSGIYPGIPSGVPKDISSGIYPKAFKYSMSFSRIFQEDSIATPPVVSSIFFFCRYSRNFSDISSGIFLDMCFKIPLESPF